MGAIVNITDRGRAAVKRMDALRSEIHLAVMCCQAELYVHGCPRAAELLEDDIFMPKIDAVLEPVMAMIPKRAPVEAE